MFDRLVARDGSPVCLRLATEEDAVPFAEAVDSVAQERAYFTRSRFEVDEEQERAFVATARERGDLILLAITGGRVVGWVTLLRARPEFLQHTAELGMGVVRGYRGLGIGTALLVQAIRWAGARSLDKVNLRVRASNQKAKALYLRFGFVQEGYRAREICDPLGGYDDIAEMAYFLPPPQTETPGAAEE